MQLQVPCFLLWVITMVLSSTTLTSTCNLDCSSSTRKYQVAGEPIHITCPPKINDTYNSISWFVKRSSDCEIVPYVNNNDTLYLSSVSGEQEQEYYCRLVLNSNYVSDRRSSCLFVLGRSILQCNEDDNCNKMLEATEQENVTFNASIKFINGGFMNQPISLFFHKRNEPHGIRYTCDGDEMSCQDSETVKVYFERNDNVLDVRLSLINLTLSETGLYLVKLKAYSRDRTTLLSSQEVEFNLSVVASTPVTTVQESTTTISETTTTAETTTTTTTTAETTTTAATEVTDDDTTLSTVTTLSTEALSTNDPPLSDVVLTAVLITAVFCTVLIAIGIIVVAATKLKSHRSRKFKSGNDTSTNDTSTTGGDFTPTDLTTNLFIDMVGKYYPTKSQSADTNSELRDSDDRHLTRRYSVFSSHNDPVQLSHVGFSHHSHV